MGLVRSRYSPYYFTFSWVTMDIHVVRTYTHHTNTRSTASVLIVQQQVGGHIELVDKKSTNRRQMTSSATIKDDPAHKYLTEK